ncbi:MAG: threonine/serine exporter family protein [Porphyromonadaceae bacterium]|nr:threonine/serine exporter family protein [Porphyromonadaceae bacterium]
MVQNILLDGLYAALAAIGFAAVSNPPKQSFIYVPILAALGHMLRFVLMTHWSVDIALATFLASVLIGAIGIYFAYRARFPSEVFAFPALLPMIPGMYAYRSLLGMIRFMETTDPNLKEAYLPQIFSNAITATTTMFALGVGVAIPLFLFYKASFRMTRDKSIAKGAHNN